MIPELHNSTDLTFGPLAEIVEEKTPGRRLPDFITMGAMKAGTTSIRSLLGQHRGLFVAPDEVPFFSLDDVMEHRAFCLETHGSRLFQDFHDRYDRYVDWYIKRFDRAEPHQLVGDASTAYMSSRRAAERIRAQMPDVKLLFSVRNPASRAYSHYWHIVKRGWAVHSFEDSLMYEPGTLLSRGYYRDQLEFYYELFPRDQIHVVVFEDLLRDPHKELEPVWDFLGVDRPKKEFQLPHKNRSMSPRSLTLQLLGNRLLRGGLPQCDPTNVLEPPLDIGFPLLARKARTAVGKLNLTPKRYPPMVSETREALGDLFSEVNRGLSGLVGRDVSKWWSITV